MSVGVVSAPAAAAEPTFTLTALSATVTGASVKASTTIRASTTTTVTQAGVCARSASDAQVDFPRKSGAVIRSTGTNLPATKTFAAGTYSYFACVLYAGTWRMVGPAKTFTVGPTPVQNTGALATWRKAVAGRAKAPARFVAVGDSITEGQGASTRANRWLDRTRDSLRTRFPVPGVKGGSNYLPATYRVYAPESTWGHPYTSTGIVTPTYWTPTLGYRSLLIDAGASATYSVTGTAVDIWYAGGPPTGTLTYRVDSGPTVSVRTAGSYSASLRVRNVSLGAAGPHKIRISAVSAGVYLGGLTVYNGDRNAGIHVFESAFSGATVATFIDDLGQFHSSVAAVSPDLITIELGPNDYLLGVSPDTFKAQLEELIAELQTLPKVPSILLVISFETAPVDSYAAYPFSDYAAAMHQLSAEDPTHVAAVDLSQLMPESDSSGTGYYSADALHPNNAGQRRIAEIITSVLSR